MLAVTKVSRRAREECGLAPTAAAPVFDRPTCRPVLEPLGRAAPAAVESSVDGGAPIRRSCPSNSPGSTWSGTPATMSPRRTTPYWLHRRGIRRIVCGLAAHKLLRSDWSVEAPSMRSRALFSPLTCGSGGKTLEHSRVRPLSSNCDRCVPAEHMNEYKRSRGSRLSSRDSSTSRSRRWLAVPSGGHLMEFRTSAGRGDGLPPTRERCEGTAGSVRSA